ncbi:hypothetical protein [Persicobacter diffluens]|uniref:Uncharacterized protein n=1 Tax=Persicobacter diffluens TaxID=981 RepID=A0AAN4W392_9BACT|nr:hypothetical protein PEDI_54710 [Persicobacter diffluens]
MKKFTLIFILTVVGISTSIAQTINQTDINTTCFVLSELMTEAIRNEDTESVLIYSNTIEKIRKKYTINKKYEAYFNSIKVLNPNIKGILISLNNPPKSPGFSNKEIDDFILLRKSGISLMDFNEFLTLKKLGQGTIKIENMHELELKNIEKFKKEVEAIKLKN